MRRIEALFQLGGSRPAQAKPVFRGLPEQVSGQFNQQKIEKVLDFLEFIDILLPKESAVISFDGAFHSECQMLNINFPSHYTRRIDFVKCP
jgi:hypothetical protein